MGKRYILWIYVYLITLGLCGLGNTLWLQVRFNISDSAKSIRYSKIFRYTYQFSEFIIVLVHTFYYIFYYIKHNFSHPGYSKGRNQNSINGKGVKIAQSTKFCVFSRFTMWDSRVTQNSSLIFINFKEEEIKISTNIKYQHIHVLYESRLT